MIYVNLDSLDKRLDAIARDFNSRTPYRYVVIDNFFREEPAQMLLAAYPPVRQGHWDGTTYINQQNKFQRTQFEPDSPFANVFSELNSRRFLEWLERLTGIRDLRADASLFGGGLHQSTSGAFLNVHVDFNIHPVTQDLRCLNLLIYMNKAWKREYEGYLELWRESEGRMEQIDSIEPCFNRCVLFETNEVSYHGHPVPLKTPADITRKSLATYYYRAAPHASLPMDAHNTIYVNTEGIAGLAKRLRSGMRAAVERLLGK